MKDIKPYSISLVVFDIGSSNSPFSNTTRLIEYGLERWILEKVGLFCPKCDIKMQPDWSFCPSCGWTWRENDKGN
jgi:hypothetical protein